MCALTEVRMKMDQVKEDHYRRLEWGVERDQVEMERSGCGWDAVDAEGRRERFKAECERFSRELILVSSLFFISFLILERLSLSLSFS